MSTISYLIGAHSVTVFFEKKPYTISNEAANYNLVLEAIKNDDMNALRDALEIRAAIVTSLTNVGGDKIRIDGTRIMYGDYEITGLVSTRIFEMMRLGLDVKPMVRFCEKLMQNPSNRAVNELFGFLDACSLPITEDGCFLTYKRVRHDYKDVYTGTIDNSVGQTVSVPRNQVDEDSDRTCSHGLHVCSYDYLAHYSGDRIMVCKVDPANVVAIPKDYRNSKMRVCEYVVVDELPVSDFAPTTKIKDWYTDDYSDDWSPEDDDYEDEDDWDESFVDDDEEDSEDDEIFIGNTSDDDEQPESSLTALELLMAEMDENEFENLQNDLQALRDGETNLTLDDLAKWYEVDEDVLESYYNTFTPPTNNDVIIPRYEVVKFDDIHESWIHHSNCHSRQDARNDKWELRNQGIASYIYDRESGSKTT